MASTVIRRAAHDADLTEVKRRLNTLLDLVNGNLAGRINLDADDGIARNPIGGASVTTGNYALRLRSAAGKHLLARNAGNSADVLDVQDSGITFGAGLTLGGNLTFTGAARRILADLSNATTSNRLLLQSSTVNGATDLGVMPNGTSAIAALSVFNNSTPASATVQAMIRVNGSAFQIRSESPAASYLPIQFLTSGVVAMTLETNGILTEAYGVRLGNAIYLLGRNAAGSADVNLIRLNASDIMETGATGTRHNLLGTVVAPAIDPPTVNGQVTNEALGKANYSGYISGTALADGAKYNIASATYNAAGNYTIAWDRDFSSAFYGVVLGLEHDGTPYLTMRVNSKTASSADIHIETTAGVLTDPSIGFHVWAFGSLV